MKPQVVSIEPKIMGFSEPNLDIMIPDVGPNIKSMIAKGSWILPVSTELSPNPMGSGLWTRIGIV